MSHAEGVRSLIGMAECPYCQNRPVYLGEAEPREQIQEIFLDGRPDPIDIGMPRWWICAHGPAERAHRWETAGPIEIRPVFGLHVDVVPR